MELKYAENYQKVGGFASPNIPWKIKKGTWRWLAYSTIELILLFCLFAPALHLIDVFCGEFTNFQRVLLMFVCLYSINVTTCYALSRLPYFRATGSQ